MNDGTLDASNPTAFSRSVSLTTPKSLALTPSKNLEGSKVPGEPGVPMAAAGSPPIGPVSRLRADTFRLGVTSPPERSPWPANSIAVLVASSRNTSAVLSVNPRWRYSAG